MLNNTPLASSLLRQQQHDPATFRLTPIVAAVITSLTLLSSGQLMAADDSTALASLQAEIAQIKAENARLKEQLGQQNPSTPTAGNAQQTTEATPETAGKVAQKIIPEAPNQGDAALLDAVTVTTARVKEIPKSISIVTGEELAKFQINNFRDIVNRIGNVRSTWQNPNTASNIIRGVGWAAGAGVLDPSVGVTEDGVSFGISSVAALSNYSDIESVDVTRGPAGVDGGKSSNVGRINIKSRAPSFTPEARASLTIGQLNTITGTATIGGGIVDDLLAYRLTVHRETSDGPYANKNDTHFTWRNTDRTNARAQFLLTPTDKIEAKVTLDFTPTGREVCENCFAFRLKTPATYDWIDPKTGNPALVNYTEDNFGKINRRWFAQKTDYSVADYYKREINTVAEYPNTYATKGGSLHLNWDLGDGLALSSITAYRDYRFSQGAGTHTQFEWLRAPRGTQTEYQQISQEVKVDAKISNSLKLQGGLYYFLGEFPNTSQRERYGSDGGAWYANDTQYQSLDAGKVVAGLLGTPNPLLTPSGRNLLLNSVDGLITLQRNKLENESIALYSNGIWDVTPDFTLSAGLRVTNESRKTSASSSIESNGFAAELNPVFVNNVKTGGFETIARATGKTVASGTIGAGTAANIGFLNTSDPTQILLANATALKYFGVSTYAALTGAQAAQIADAKAIRAARIGALYQQTNAQAYEETLPTSNVSLNYRLDELNNVFVSWKHGEKAGISQIIGGTVLGGRSVPVKSEKTNSYELGIKSLLLDKTLSVNATIYLQDIANYIQPIQFYDAVQVGLNGNNIPVYLNGLNNVPKVQTKGAELDFTYSGIRYTTLRFSGAYTDARYKDYKFAPVPGELSGDSTHPYFDATGKQLAGAPKFSGNVFADFSYPIWGQNVFHSNLNYNFQTGYYADPLLSRYSMTRTWGVADISVGIARPNKKFDVSFIAKNIFNQDTSLQPTWNSYKPGVPRWVGVILNAEL